jgi:multidrug/hemolysin transport system ATP-binding protein
MPKAISIQNLVKKYGSFMAVDDISFDVDEGCLFAFLGPNGAGKSTTIKIICALLEKTAGSVEVCGFELDRDNARIRESIGVVFQDNMLDDLLAVKENLIVRGGLYNKSKRALDEKLASVSAALYIDDILKRPYGKLSGGQKRRVDIARALMSNPQLLILDEPTTGLDPQARINVWEIIHNLKKESRMTVFLTTHYMEEAANADMVSIIDKGKIVASGTPNELKIKHSSDVLRLVSCELETIKNELIAKGYKAESIADVLTANVQSSMEAYTLLKEYEGRYSSFEVIRGSMDDVFVNITGRALREDV